MVAGFVDRSQDNVCNSSAASVCVCVGGWVSGRVGSKRKRKMEQRY